ncbi:MAG: hypothetical protein IIB41_01895 [Candidatus Marinimicrobia bacterium]|nr:hypothetical protein [Candidatus Neomarinimicrobiota bacterium]TFB10445.1 hypothetical protein E3V36_03670 [Candidatus Marinimicrobia bacterium MT.SAG.2]
MKQQIIMIGLIVLTLATTSWAQVKSESSQKNEVKIRKSNPDGKVGVIFLDFDATIYESSDVSYKQGGGQTFMPTGFGHNKFSIGVGVPIFKTLTLFGGYQRLSSTTKSDFGNWNYTVTSNAIFIKGRFYLDFK